MSKVIEYYKVFLYENKKDIFFVITLGVGVLAVTLGILLIVAFILWLGNVLNLRGGAC